MNNFSLAELHKEICVSRKKPTINRTPATEYETETANSTPAQQQEVTTSTKVSDNKLDFNRKILASEREKLTASLLRDYSSTTIVTEENTK